MGYNPYGLCGKTDSEERAVKIDLGELDAFVAVARAGGFRDAARISGRSASGLSDAVRRLEAQIGVRFKF